MTSERTGTTYAILGLLSVRQWTTYELAKQVQRSLNWFWPRAERKLYDEPKRLAADGLATASVEQTGKRPRTVYEITDAGRAELRHWLDLPSAPRSGEFEAMVKVFFADAGDLGQLRTTLERIATESRERITTLGELTAGVAAEPRFPERLHLNALTVRLQLDQEVAVLRWTQWALQQVSAWHATSEPGSWDTQAALAEVVTAGQRAVGMPEAPAEPGAP